MDWFQAMVLCILKHQSRKEKKAPGVGRAHKFTGPGANFTINPAHDFSIFYFLFVIGYFFRHNAWGHDVSCFFTNWSALLCYSLNWNKALARGKTPLTK